MKEALRWKAPVAIVRKYDHRGRLQDVVASCGNVLTTSGMARLLDRIAGTASVEGLHETSVRLGVGDLAVVADPNDDTLAEDNEWYQVLDANHPVINGNSIIYKATFGADDANFTWACWGLDVDDDPPASSGDTPEDLFNRKLFNFGTKDGAIWDLSVIISVTQ